MKEVKMLGMTDCFLEKVQSLRVDELRLARDFRTLIVWMNVLGSYSGPHNIRLC